MSDTEEKGQKYQFILSLMSMILGLIRALSRRKKDIDNLE